jgi:hypothetical protein
VSDKNLRVLFGRKQDKEILSALGLLAGMQGLAVKVQKCGDLEPESVPLPLAEYKGDSHVHEYGHEAVLALIKALRSGELR